MSKQTVSNSQQGRNMMKINYFSSTLFCSYFRTIFSPLSVDFIILLRPFLWSIIFCLTTRLNSVVKRFETSFWMVNQLQSMFNILILMNSIMLNERTTLWIRTNSSQLLTIYNSMLFFIFSHLHLHIHTFFTIFFLSEHPRLLCCWFCC